MSGILYGSSLKFTILILVAGLFFQNCASFREGWKEGTTGWELSETGDGYKIYKKYQNTEVTITKNTSKTTFSNEKVKYEDQYTTKVSITTKDKDLIKKLATRHKIIEVRRAATACLKDQSDLMEIVFDSTYTHDYAVERISNQDCLKEIALKSLNEQIARHAGRRITNQIYLEEVAKNAKIKNVKYDVLSRITDPKFFEKQAFSGEDKDIRRSCIQRVNNQEILRRIVIEESDSGVVEAAIMQVTDQSLLEAVARKYWSVGGRRLAIQKLTNEDVLREIIISENYKWVRETAEKRLKELREKSIKKSN